MAKGPKNSPLWDQMFGQAERGNRVISWDVADPALCYRIVVAVNAAGGSVLFGASRKRDVWGMTFFHDRFGGKGTKPEWCPLEDEVNTWLLEWAESWEAIAEEIAAQNR